MLHTCQQAGQVIGVGGCLLAALTFQRRLDDRGLDGGGLDVNSLQFAGCGSPGSAGVIGVVRQIDGVELVLVVGSRLGGIPVADRNLIGRNAVCTDRNGGGVQQCVSRSTLAVEVDKTGGDTLGGVVIRDGRGQRDLLALELGEVVSGENIGCTVDRHICGFIISAGDFQRGGGVLKINFHGRCGDQHGFILVFLQSIAGVILRGLGEVAGRAGDRRYDRAEHILGIGRVDRSGIAAGGVGVIRPDAISIAILPRDRVVLVHGQLGAMIIERVDRGQFQRVDLTGDHGGDRSAGLIRDGQNIGVGVDLGGRIQLPADGGGLDRDGLRGALDLGIAVALGGDEDGLIGVLVRVAVLKAAGLGRVDGGAAADDRAGELRPLGAAVRRTVELHRAGGDGSGAGRDRRGQRDILALVLHLGSGGVINGVADFQRNARLLGLPDGVEDGVRSEIGNIRRHRISLCRVRVRGDSGAVGRSPAEEVVALALRHGLADLAVVRAAGQVVVHRFLHRAAVTAVIIINDRHGFARDADDGDIGVLLRGELVGVGLAVFTLALGGVQHVVDTDLHLRCVVAIVDLDGEGHGGAVNHHVAASQRCCGRCAHLGAGHDNGVARRRGGPSDLRGDGLHLGVDGGGADHLVGGEIPLRGEGVFLVPADELEALDHGVSGAGGNGTLLHLLFCVERTDGSLKGHGERQVLADFHGNDLIGLDVADGIGVAHRLIGVRDSGGGTQGTAAAGNGDHGRLLRIFTGHGDGKGKAAAVLNRSALLRVDAVALAGGQGDSVGVRFPHGVEGGGGASDLLREGRAGEVGRDARAVGLAPTEEGAAILDRDDLGQRGRQTVGLGDRSGSGAGPVAAFQIIRDRCLIGHVTAVEDGIPSNRGVKVELRGVGLIRIPLSVPIVAGLVRGGQRRGLAAICDALPCHLRAVKNVGHGMELDRGHIDRYGLIGLDVLDLVGTGGGIRGQLHAVRIHASDGVAGARRHGEVHSAVIAHGRELVDN